MKFSISQDIIEKFPDVKIGIVVATNIDNSGEDAEVMHLLKNEQESVKKKFDLETLKENPSISVWRKIYESFGSKPRDYRSSIEALVRTVLNGRGIRHINKLVDIYNYVSLKHAIPVGGEDFDKVAGNLHLKFSDGSEIFMPLGTETEDNPYKGEVIYCDDGNNVLCRRWNWRESDKTKLLESTKNAVIVAEGFDGRVEKATEEIAELIRAHCSGETDVFIADKENREIEFDIG